MYAGRRDENILEASEALTRLNTSCSPTRTVPARSPAACPRRYRRRCRPLAPATGTPHRPWLAVRKRGNSDRASRELRQFAFDATQRVV